MRYLAALALGLATAGALSTALSSCCLGATCNDCPDKVDRDVPKGIYVRYVDGSPDGGPDGGADDGGATFVPANDGYALGVDRSIVFELYQLNGQQYEVTYEIVSKTGGVEPTRVDESLKCLVLQ